ncbi:MAG: outer membrane beta-barrel protein [Maribacter dokdonensis]|uniref:outer membrane beta-barrel protein n=1 Tax=Maribacter dokdonensis TaxID=320912 RepID=UPI002AAF7A91|nr:outer membrane beta-barrel protein [Maribacter dokdonensis]
MKKSVLTNALSLVFFAICAQVSSQVTNISVIDSSATMNTPVSLDSTTTEQLQTVDSLVTVDPRLKFGCGFGLNFLGGTNISLSPNLIYIVSDNFSLGAGVQGSYNSIKNVQKTTTFGANVIGQYNLSKKLMSLLEFAQLKVNTKQETPTGEIKDDFWESALFVGAGYNINNKISIGAKFNVLYDDDESVYSSPIIPFVNITF